MRKITVDPVGGFFLGGFVDQDLIDDLLDKIILLVDDILLIAAVNDVIQIERIVLRHVFVRLQQLDGVPS